MGTWKLDKLPHFSSTVSALTVCNIYLKILKIHFHMLSTLVHYGL